MKHKPIPAMAGPRYFPEKRKPFRYDPAMQEAIRRSARQPKLISMNSKGDK